MLYISIRVESGHARLALLTLAAKRIGGGLLQSFGDFCPSSVCLSVAINPPMLNGKGRHRASTHSRLGIRSIKEVSSLCLHGTYLNYMTDCHSVLCWSVVNAVIAGITGSGSHIEVHNSFEGGFQLV